MRPLIPFVHQSSSSEAQQWCTTLSELLPQCDVRLFEQLSDEDKARVTMAVVANPEPSDVAQLSQLKWVHSVWAGVEGMMANLAEMPFGIVRLTDPHLAQTMSEAVLAWALYLHREMPQYRQQQSSGQWQSRDYTDACDRHIVILGLGLLGQKSALRLVDNGFKVSGWSRSEKQLANVDCYSGDEALTEVIGDADIIVNLLPLTPATEGLMDQAFFRQLKGASLINFGRGATIVDADLLQALEQGQVSHAVLDVFTEEPLPSSHAFWQHPDITVLPHISAPTSVSTASRIVADNISRFLLEGVIPPTVDKTLGY
ncbi:glyoxylate/hydroxypyruvate reductase A [Amphritea opalescens]|uniref:Glyoxylate/hydroxypyruvate reductase A n=1 Tax=Amphritea opalescens TaxID=2490544 RepID=A0A430KVC5_9GAMM|nr:glyoxylate/hydroxypyruvate reductase A [Amphritea opalescens]RTE67429.1 glyoxylate/hydroxypyruvate reductase A [Amphritea opalescens]